MKGTFQSLGLLGILMMVVAIWKMSSLPLWGYWPLSLGVGLCLTLVPIYAKINFSLRHIGLALSSGILLSISFPPIPIPIIAMVGFLPLLYLIDQHKEKGSWALVRTIGGLSFLAFLLWNVGATFWVMNTALAAGIFANVANAFLMSIPLTGFALVRKSFNSRYHWISWIAIWTAFEFIHYNWDLHWPWLSLGNSMASWPWAIQWYDITGVLGGSVWILLVNWLLYQAIFYTESRIRNYALAVILVIGGIIFSLLHYPARKVNPERVSFAIIQPNFEPHYEKFEFSEQQQIRNIGQLIDAATTDTTDYLILPETVFTLNLNNLRAEPGYQMLKAYQQKYPDLEIIVGLATQRVLDPEEKEGRFTRISTLSSGEEVRWEAGNTALYLRDTVEELYFKSQLVPGAEFFPYYNLLFFLEPIVDQLEGSIKGFKTQESASVFKGEANVGPIICYESIFGEYCREYIAKGAEVFTVITNDGWWDMTPGHMQHFSYSKLLAIQHRRAIARAANTGISALILPNGDVIKSTDYGEEAVLTGMLPLSKEITFYSRWGNLAGRASLFVVIVLLMQGLYMYFKRKTTEKGS